MKLLIIIFIGIFALAKGKSIIYLDDCHPSPTSLYPKLPVISTDECYCNGKLTKPKKVHWPDTGDVTEVRYYVPDSREHKSDEGCFQALTATIDSICHNIKQALKPNTYVETREACQCCKRPFEPPTPKSILKKPSKNPPLPK